MNSPEFIRAKLSNRLNADCSEQDVKNNRYHYRFRFEEALGWDWVYTQVGKASSDLETDLELYKIRPSGMADFEIEVREVNRRRDIDNSQHGLTDFE